MNFSYKFFTLLLGLVNCLASIAQKSEKIPVIIIMADQLRSDAIGVFTPNINNLKNDGIAFNRAYVSVPLCAPSRSSFFTGLYANRTGSLINPFEKVDKVYGVTRAGIPNMYGLMQEQWDSYHIGKQHFYTEENIDKKNNGLTKWITQENYNSWLKELKKTKPGGKDYKATVPELLSASITQLGSNSTPEYGIYKEGADYYFDHFIASEALKVINQKPNGKPLLLNLMFLAPHPPFSIPEPYFSLVRPNEITVPQNVGQWYDGQSPLQLYNITGFLGSRYNRNEWIDIWTKYMGLVKLLDDEVGRVIEGLKAAGLYDKALILFTADHGEMLGSHSLWQKMCMYEESVRVPFILKLPSGFKKQIDSSDALVSLVDFLPTLLDLNGMQALPVTDGESLLPLIRGQKVDRESVFIQYDGNGSLGGKQRCVVKGNYKLIVDMFKDETYIELYDVVKDPQETVNLIFHKEHAGIADELMFDLQIQMKNTGDRIQFSKDLIKTFLNKHPLKAAPFDSSQNQ